MAFHIAGIPIILAAILLFFIPWAQRTGQMTNIMTAVQSYGVMEDASTITPSSTESQVLVKPDSDTWVIAPMTPADLDTSPTHIPSSAGTPRDNRDDDISDLQFVMLDLEDICAENDDNDDRLLTSNALVKLRNAEVELAKSMSLPLDDDSMNCGALSGVDENERELSNSQQLSSRSTPGSSRQDRSPRIEVR